MSKNTIFKERRSDASMVMSYARPTENSKQMSRNGSMQALKLSSRINSMVRLAHPQSSRDLCRNAENDQPSLGTEDSSGSELQRLEERAKELEARNYALEEKCRLIRMERIKVIRKCSAEGVEWRREKMGLIEINRKLMKMMERIKKEIAHEAK